MKKEKIAGNMKDGKDPCLASIIVPVYHTEEALLLTAVQSLTGQSEERIEILLVFDGSFANYEALVCSPVFADERIRLISRPHRGVSGARNEGLALARGTWVMFVDSDDCLPRNAVRELLRGADDKTDLVVGDYRIRTAAGTEEHLFRKQEFYAGPGEKTEFLGDILNPQTGLGFCWGKLFRRSVLLAERLCFEEKLEAAEDADFVLRFALRAGGIRYLPRPVYIYQMHAGSAVRAFREDYAERYERAMACIRRTLREAGCEKELDRAYETFVLYHLLLITVNSSFHPEREGGRREQIRAYKQLLKKPLYQRAARRGQASRFTLSRRLCVWMIRLHLWNGVYAAARFRHRQLGL